MSASNDQPRTSSRLVFVSYATADRKQALQICKALERRGTLCWISTRDVPAGANYQEAIVGSLRAARAMVLVFSDAANNSDEIKKELSLASRYHVPVMALRIEDVEPSDAFAYELSTRQWIDAFHGWDRSIDALAERLQSVTDGAASAQAIAPKRTQRPFAIRSRVSMMAAAAVLLLIAAAGAWFVLRPAPVAAHSMQVRLTGFSTLSNDLPANFPAIIQDEITAAFANDGVVGVSTAASPPPGSAPAYALGGTVRLDGDKVRVITKLTDERSGVTLWSNSYSYDRDAVSKVPRYIAVEAGNQVRCGLFAASTYPKPLPDQAMADYLQSCVALDHARDPSRGLAFARKVVVEAPDFSWGWSSLEIAGLESIFNNHALAERSALRQEALNAGDTAVRLDPSNSEALSWKSGLIDQGDLTGREALLERAKKARPLACGCEHLVHGWFLSEVGRLNEAVDQFEQSTNVLALNSDSQFALAQALFTVGRSDEANVHLDAARDLSPDAETSPQIGIWYAPFNSDYAAGLKAAHDPKLQLSAALRQGLIAGFEAMLSRDPAAKSRAIATLSATSVDTDSDIVVALLGALGANAQALRRVEDASRADVFAVRQWLFFPTMAGALRDPAFPGVAQRLGLLRYWKASHTRPDACSGKGPPPFCRMI